MHAAKFVLAVVKKPGALIERQGLGEYDRLGVDERVSSAEAYLQILRRQSFDSLVWSRLATNNRGSMKLGAVVQNRRKNEVIPNQTRQIDSLDSVPSAIESDVAEGLHKVFISDREKPFESVDGVF